MAITRLNNNSITSITALPSGVGGVTMADQFRLISDLSTDDTTLTNLERTDSTGFGTVGNGMTESSGIFTFPSTGIYFIGVCATFVANTDDTIKLDTHVTLNNSSYQLVASAQGGDQGNRSNSGSSHYLLDVTNTSNVKVKFVSSSLGGSSVISGSTSSNLTAITFIKLGET